MQNIFDPTKKQPWWSSLCHSLVPHTYLELLLYCWCKVIRPDLRGRCPNRPGRKVNYAAIKICNLPTQTGTCTFGCQTCYPLADVVIILLDSYYYVLSAAARLFNLAGILSGGITKSTQPVATALSGIWSTSADISWEKVFPPCVLMCLQPSVPSPSYPERTMPIARTPIASAKEIKNISICLFLCDRGEITLNLFFSIERSESGGMM